MRSSRVMPATFLLLLTDVLSTGAHAPDTAPVGVRPGLLSDSPLVGCPGVPFGDPRVHAVVATPIPTLLGLLVLIDPVRVLMTMRFSNQFVAELYQPFWAAWQAGEFLTDAAAVAGTHRHRGLAWLRQAGGVRPRRGRNLQGRYLSFAEREEIAMARAAGESIRQVARRLGRSPSTISRELARNADRAAGTGRARRTCWHISGAPARSRRSW